MGIRAFRSARGRFSSRAWPALRAARLAALAVCMATLPAGAAVVEGQIFDETGQPLAGVTVRLVHRTGGGLIPAFSADVQEEELASGVSDRNGFFAVELKQEVPPRGRLLLRCFDSARWDGVRYAPPVDHEIGLELRRDARALAMCRVADAPGWAAVAKAIARAGGATTAKGRVLRSAGLPQQVVPVDGGRTEWRYHGTTYVFAGEELVETRAEGTPAAPAAPAAAPPAGGA